MECPGEFLGVGSSHELDSALFDDVYERASLLHVFPLLQKDAFNVISRDISTALVDVGLSTLVDVTGTSIGKRYARTDEIGVPFAVTVDHQTLDDDTVTLRERDTCDQIRVHKAVLPKVLKDLVDLKATWAEVVSKFPSQAAGEETADAKGKVEISLRCP